MADKQLEPIPGAGLTPADINKEITERLGKRTSSRNAAEGATSQFAKEGTQGANLYTAIGEQLYPGKNLTTLSNEDKGAITREMARIREEGSVGEQGELHPTIKKGTEKWEEELASRKPSKAATGDIEN